MNNPALMGDSWAVSFSIRRVHIPFHGPFMLKNVKFHPGLLFLIRIDYILKVNMIGIVQYKIDFEKIHETKRLNE